jgi:alpha-tubulin suppressor-like RCC1 family protein
MADLPPIACSAVPVAVAGGLTFTRLTAGSASTYGLTGGGAAYVLGDTLPAVPGGLTFVELALGSSHACGLTSGGAAYCWGGNSFGQLGDNSTVGHTTPVAVAGGLAFTRLIAGYWHTCGLTSGGKAYCWGWNSVGQLGDGSTTRRLAPVGVAGGLVFANLTAGGEHSCGVTSGGAAYCWGSNDYSELGTTANFSSCLLNSSGDFSRCSVLPVAVAGGLTFASLTAGYLHTCGLTSGGAAYCWGDDLFGELGDGSTINLVAVANP